MFVFIARIPRLKWSQFCPICNKVVRSWAIAPRHVRWPCAGVVDWQKGKKLLISYNRNRIHDMEWKCTAVMKQTKLAYGWEDNSLVLTKFNKWSIISSNYTPWWRVCSLIWCQPTCRKPSNGYDWLTQNHAFLNPNNISISNIPLSTRS
jgi:hypothetical protein